VQVEVLCNSWSTADAKEERRKKRRRGDVDGEGEGVSEREAEEREQRAHSYCLVDTRHPDVPMVRISVSRGRIMHPPSYHTIPYNTVSCFAPCVVLDTVALLSAQWLL
jgi:hypothetical protein